MSSSRRTNESIVVLGRGLPLLREPVDDEPLRIDRGLREMAEMLVVCEQNNLSAQGEVGKEIEPLRWHGHHRTG